MRALMREFLMLGAPLNRGEIDMASRWSKAE
jgi:hypothetical protein